MQRGYQLSEINFETIVTLPQQVGYSLNKEEIPIV